MNIPYPDFPYPIPHTLYVITMKLSYSELKTLITQKWPESFYAGSDWSSLHFTTGHPELDRLFPATGIPYGQLIELTGDTSSGKTSILFMMLSGIIRTGNVAYVDFCGSFFPSAALVSGLDVDRILVVRPDSISAGLRAAELVLRHRLACCVVLDLVGERTHLPHTLIHRLRLHTVRAKAIVIFLTENNSDLIPASMTSLKLEISRTNTAGIAVKVARSRISQEGISTEVLLS